MTDYIELLQNTHLFEGIANDVYKDVLNCLEFKVQSFSKDEIIYNYHDPIEYAGLVVKGEVKSNMLNCFGNEHRVKVYNTGDLFGLAYACLEDELSCIQICARTDCKVLFLKVSNLFKPQSAACSNAFRVATNLIHISAKQTTEQNIKINILTQKSVRDKITTYLSTCTSDSNVVELSLNRQELADYLNIERSALSRELSRMKNEGLIDYSKNKITILYHE